MSIYPGERCQHIKLSGDRCGASALRDQKFCRFHDYCGMVKVDVSVSAAFPATPFYLPVLEDAASIQYTINQVCEHLLHHRLDAKKAGVMLYAMQIASSNLDRLSECNSGAKGNDDSQDGSQKKSEPEGREHDDIIGDALAAVNPSEKPGHPQLSNPAKSSV